MPIGGGRYENELTEMRERLKAEGVILIVIDGSRGTGFGIQGTMRVIAALPMMLMEIAGQIAKDLTEHRNDFSKRP